MESAASSICADVPSSPLVSSTPNSKPLEKWMAPLAVSPIPGDTNVNLSDESLVLQKVILHAYIYCCTYHSMHAEICA